jgi:hypothetical protein
MDRLKKHGPVLSESSPVLPCGLVHAGGLDRLHAPGFATVAAVAMDSTAGLTVDSLRARVRAVKRLHGGVAG